MKKLLTISVLSLILLSACGQNNQTLRTTPKEDIKSEVAKGIMISNVEIPAYKLYYIKPGDNGTSGEKIGCDDSLSNQEIYMDEKPELLKDLMKIAFENLLAGEQIPQGSETFLGKSKLNIESINVTPDYQATIKLKGQLQLNGTCDAPRIQAQLEKTASQFPFLQKIDILINDQPLADALSTK